jgi:hypothetical protein
VAAVSVAGTSVHATPLGGGGDLPSQPSAVAGARVSVSGIHAVATRRANAPPDGDFETVTLKEEGAKAGDKPGSAVSGWLLAASLSAVFGSSVGKVEVDRALALQGDEGHQYMDRCPHRSRCG